MLRLQAYSFGFLTFPIGYNFRLRLPAFPPFGALPGANSGGNSDFRIQRVRNIRKPSLAHLLQVYRFLGHFYAHISVNTDDFTQNLSTSSDTKFCVE